MRSLAGLTSNDYHCEVKFKWGFKKPFMMSLLFENCKSVDLNSRHSINIYDDLDRSATWLLIEI